MTAADSFAHDPPLPLPPWPALDPLRALARTEPSSDAAPPAIMKSCRSVNRVLHGQRIANEALDMGRDLPQPGW